MKIIMDFIGMIIMGVAYFMKFTFDLLIVRESMIAYEVIKAITADRVVDIFPGVVGLFKSPGMMLYNAMYVASQVMTVIITHTVGIPKCEGATVLIGSVALIMVLTVLSIFLNFDMFGLYAAARQTVKSTKPECQRSLA